jgi:hypothetical protein
MSSRPTLTETAQQEDEADEAFGCTVARQRAASEVG